VNHLTNILKNKNISQAKLAELLKKDASTVNRWCKNNRSIPWGMAEKIANVSGCHPVDVYETREKNIIKFGLTHDCKVKKYGKNEEETFIAPYEFRSCKIINVDLICHLQGKLFFDNKLKKIRDVLWGKICLIHTQNKIYCGTISFDQNPYTGEAIITDILNYTKINIGNYKNIEQIYECIFQSF